jgi:hypothetical protein
LLQLATPEGVFAIEVGLIFPQTTEAASALERLQRRHWITLMSTSGISTNPDARQMRIFMASDAAMEWFRIQKLWRQVSKFACATHLSQL